MMEPAYHTYESRAGVEVEVDGSIWKNQRVLEWSARIYDAWNSIDRHKTFSRK